MSQYENRDIPEGINYSRENPLKEFAILTTAAIGILLAIIIALSLSASWMAPLIPFSVEKRLLESSEFPLPQQVLEGQALRRQQFLRLVSDSLLQQQRDLPADFQIQVHYLEGDIVNAFATLGGHVYVFEGLWDLMPSENALVMVLAHEIAHVIHRDPLVALGRGMTVSLALMSVAGLVDTRAVEWLLNTMGNITVVGFNREQEAAADQRALEMLQAFYGNVSDAEQVFEIFSEQQAGAEPPAFLSTHPQNAQRIERIRDFARTHPQQGKVFPLPEAAP